MATELIPFRLELPSKWHCQLQAARRNLVRAVNHTMVYTYYEIGRMIVEYEQHGKERAEYGKQVCSEAIKIRSNSWRPIWNRIKALLLSKH
jgi:hypothetical protein